MKNTLILIVFLFCRSLWAESSADGFTVRAVLEPVREAAISSEISTSIETIRVRNGETFRQGDPLILFDCAVYQAGFSEASAELGIARAQLENKQKLQKLNSAGKLEVLLARLEVDRMQAKHDVAESMVKNCQVVAPFDGRVDEMLVNEHESIAAGSQLLWVLDDTTLKVNLVLPSKWLTWLQVGSEFTLVVDETGLEYAGHIVQLGARVDSVSQSIRVTGELNGSHKDLMAGMSGSVSFDRENKTE